MPLLLLVIGIVLSPEIGVGEHLVRFTNLVELLGVTRRQVVRVEAFGQQSIDPFHRLDVGTGTELQGLVVIDEVITHGTTTLQDPGLRRLFSADLASRRSPGLVRLEGIRICLTGCALASQSRPPLRVFPGSD